MREERKPSKGNNEDGAYDCRASPERRSSGSRIGQLSHGDQAVADHAGEQNGQRAGSKRQRSPAVAVKESKLQQTR